MDTFANLCRRMDELERLHLARLQETFVWSSEIQACISGGVQYGVLDSFHKAVERPMPVIVAVGINYSQDAKTDNGERRMFNHLGVKSNDTLVVSNTQCRPAVAMCLAAYNRNSEAWQHSPPHLESIAERFGSNEATKRSKLTSQRWDELPTRFILIMTNFSPFMTRLEWQPLAEAYPDACNELIERWPATDYLDDLHREIGRSVDLWIGHSAIEGTRWVWPEFLRFVDGHDIDDWMLTPNVSKRGHLYLDGAFRSESNPRFPLFGPEKT
jgi:hypothetical protein